MQLVLFSLFYIIFYSVSILLHIGVNLALTGETLQYPFDNTSSLVADNNRLPDSCSVLNGSDTYFQVDLKILHIITDIYLYFQGKTY